MRNFARPDRFEADRLIAVEVLTPGGNWGSYPPHKHDEIRADETELEEIYHYVVTDGPAGPGLAYQHVYGTPERPIDLLTTVRTGDTVLVPHGWHGPAMAAPGYDLYYLNVMAGPGERAWRACDDPSHAWVRDAWAGQAIDPRVPFGGAGVPAHPGPASIGRPSRRTRTDRNGTRRSNPGPRGTEAPMAGHPARGPRGGAGVLERGVLGGVGAPEMTALEDEWASFVGTGTRCS